MSAKKQTFEQEIARLEEIVGLLERIPAVPPGDSPSMTSFENTPDESSSAAAGRLRRSSSLPTWTLTRKFTPEFIPSKMRFVSERLPISSQIII